MGSTLANTRHCSIKSTVQSLPAAQAALRCAAGLIWPAQLLPPFYTPQSTISEHQTSPGHALRRLKSTGPPQVAVGRLHGMNTCTLISCMRWFAWKGLKIMFPPNFLPYFLHHCPEVDRFDLSGATPLYHHVPTQYGSNAWLQSAASSSRCTKELDN